MLHVRLVDWTDDDEEPFVESDAMLFCLVDGDWEGVSSGGGNWGNDPPVAPRTPLESQLVTHAVLGGAVDAEQGGKAVFGEIGADAAVLEVEQGGEVTRRPVEAPAGAFVVPADHDRPFTVRVLDADGVVLAVDEEPAGFDH